MSKDHRSDVRPPEDRQPAWRKIVPYVFSVGVVAKSFVGSGVSLRRTFVMFGVLIGAGNGVAVIVWYERGSGVREPCAGSSKLQVRDVVEKAHMAPCSSSADMEGPPRPPKT